jgi:hypothetical protein
VDVDEKFVMIGSLIVTLDVLDLNLFVEPLP